VQTELSEFTPEGDESRDVREGEWLKAPSVQPPSTREIPSSKLQFWLPEAAFNPAIFFSENSLLNIQQPRLTRLIRIRHSSTQR
jgi:hypothetical protein